MKYRIIKLLAAVTLLAATQVAHSFEKDEFYLGVNAGFNYLKANLEDYRENFSPVSLGITLGHKLNNNLALETTLGAGVADDSKVIVDDIKASLITEGYLATYLVGILPVHKNIEFFGKVGVMAIQAEAKLIETDVTPNEKETSTERETGFSYGAGMTYNLNSTHGVNFEYIKMPDIKIDDTKIKITSINLGYTYSF